VAGDVVMARLVSTSAPRVKGAHDAEFVCAGARAYIVAEANDVKAGESAGWPFIYATMSVVNLKTLVVEKVIDFAKSEQQFENETLPTGACFVPRIIEKDASTLRCYFTSEDAREEELHRATARGGARRFQRGDAESSRQHYRRMVAGTSGGSGAFYASRASPGRIVSTVPAPPGSGIYYWKCDRPAAFHGTDVHRHRPELMNELRGALAAHFDERDFPLTPTGGQGNHATFRARLAGSEVFIRVEDGPELDDYMEIESRIVEMVREADVPAPRVLAVDASRHRVSFAWQVLEFIPHPDLNQLQKRGALEPAKVAPEIGSAIGRWQGIAVCDFGPFQTAAPGLEGFHSGYAGYFHLHLDRHLRFLVERHFLTVNESDEIAREIGHHNTLLALGHGCLVHKDLAFWNILGTAERIAAFIDWDDVIAGDPMDDLSLLGCFHDGEVLGHALDGYTSVRPPPNEHRRRSWLHLLRNMIVKAVIRVGAGYFERDCGFYLIGAGGSGSDLRSFTQSRLAAALRGLRENLPIASL
jgi:fructosamine-3-kinase